MREDADEKIADAFTGRFCATAPPVSPVVSGSQLPARLPAATSRAIPDELELRTATRVWACSVQRGLFAGEPWALVVAYGAIGRKLRVLPARWFASREALERRRRELLAVRRRHGYVAAFGVAF